MEKKFVKLSSLVGEKFTFIKNTGYCWKRWDATNKKMETSQQFQKATDGWRKVYSVETDAGMVDFGVGQMGILLEKALRGNIANLTGIVFEVSSNGKKEMDIRYYFKPVGTTMVSINRDVEPEEEYPNYPDGLV